MAQKAPSYDEGCRILEEAAQMTDNQAALKKYKEASSIFSELKKSPPSPIISTLATMKLDESEAAIKLIESRTISLTIPTQTKIAHNEIPLPGEVAPPEDIPFPEAVPPPEEIPLPEEVAPPAEIKFTEEMLAPQQVQAPAPTERLLAEDVRQPEKEMDQPKTVQVAAQAKLPEEKEGSPEKISKMAVEFAALKEASIRQIEKTAALKEEALKELSELKEEVFRLRTSLDLATTERDELRTSSDRLHNTGSEYIKDLKRTFSKNQEDLEKLNKENIALYDERSALSNKNIVLSKEVSELKAELRERKSKKSSDAYKIRELEAVSENLKKSIAGISSETMSLKKDNDAYKQKIGLLKKELVTANAEVLTYANRLDEARDQMQQMRFAIKELSDIKAKFSQVQAQRVSLPAAEPDQSEPAMAPEPLLIETVVQKAKAPLAAIAFEEIGRIDEIVHLEGKPTLYVNLSAYGGRGPQGEKLYVVDKNDVVAELRVLSRYPALNSLVCEAVSYSESVVLKEGDIVAEALD